MFANLDRNEFLALLEKLGSEDDAVALNAARDLHAKVTVSGVSWEQLLAPERQDDDEDADGAPAASAGSDDETVLKAPDADHGKLSASEAEEAKELIAAIGALEISNATRDELTDYSADLKDGVFEKMDLRYLRALHKRLAK